MSDFNNKLAKYADLAVRVGVNIQKGQTLVISSPVECASFARLLVEKAYSAGAYEVIVKWNDDVCGRLKFLHANEEIFSKVSDWEVESVMEYARKGAAFLSISASDPEALKGVDPTRISTSQKCRRNAMKEYSERMMTNQNEWSIISIPTLSWAKKVFPNVSDEEAIDNLWEAIFKTVRIDKEDPIAAWDEHKANISAKSAWLNSLNLTNLHFKNSIGTDLSLDLPENYIFLGAAEKSASGVEFVANMPTEEVFSAPKKTGVNGTVVSSKPLNYNGNLIENFSLTFKDGAVTSFTAEKGYEFLKSLIETDEGSKYLGEVALVPFDSPISNSGILFFNTLYDENASCHFALGKAYASCIKDGEKMSKEERVAAGINDSLSHVDFMLGTSDLSVIGTTKSGETVAVFENGNWA